MSGGPSAYFKSKFRKSRKSKSLSKQVYGLKRQMQKFKPQVKQHCREESSLTVSSTGLTRDLTLISQGDGQNNRDGDQTTGKSLVVRFSMTQADSVNVMRLILVRYKGDGSSITTADLPISTAVNLEPLACWDENKKAKMHTILHDRIYTLSSDGGDVLTGQINVNLAGARTNWDNSVSATVPEDGGIMLYCVSDSAAATHPQLNFVSNYSYYDN